MTPRLRATFAALLITGSAIYLAYVGRPLDQHIRCPWRQADVLQIARNFHREGMDILYPRIDWRGAGPGYVESEFPLTPWLAAVLFEVFGYHEFLVRVPSVVLSIASLVVFGGLARRILDPFGALFATAAFVLNPLLFHLATAMQPEPLMLFGSLVAVALLWRWADAPANPWLLLGAAAATAVAVLGKGTAFYLGALIAYEVLRRLGRRAFVSPTVYLAAALCILPPLAWYLWARHFWLVYGNSLGISNAALWLSPDMLVPPRFLVGVLKWETLGVFTPLGWVLATAGLRNRRALAWYGATWVFYLSAAKVASDDSAFYYHCIAVAPGCLLMGAGIDALVSDRPMPVRLGALSRHRHAAAGVLACGTLASLGALIGVYLRLRDGRTDLLPLRACSQLFARYVGKSELIAFAGGPKYDASGREEPYNISMPFAWMDRKGFNYGSDELGIATLDRIAARGGRYWMASRAELEAGNLRARVDQRYRLVASCEGQYFLYDLHARPGP